MAVMLNIFFIEGKKLLSNLSFYLFSFSVIAY
jgi:hypothetical protein